MKSLTLFVALTCVLGSGAYVLPWQQQNQTRFAAFYDAFWADVSRLGKLADELLYSRIVRLIHERILQNTIDAHVLLGEMEVKLRPLSDDLVEQLRANVELMPQQISANLAEVNQLLSPFVVELQNQVAAGVTELGNSLKERENIDPEALRLEINEIVRLRIADFKAKMEPYTQEVQLKVDQGIEQFRQGLVPYVEEMQVKMIQRAQELRENLQPYANLQDVTARLSAYDQEVRQQINGIMEEIRRRN